MQTIYRIFSLRQMGAALGAEAMSHLEEVSEEGIEAMARAGTVGVLLPTTAHILRLPPPPARAMIDAGVPVALGTDFNPNAFCLSMVRCVLSILYLFFFFEIESFTHITCLHSALSP